jgi:O-antigen ligase
VVAVVWWPFDDPGFDRYHLPKELWLTGCALAVALGATVERDGVTRAAVGLAGLWALATFGATTPLLAVRGAGLMFVAVTLFLAARTVSEREAAWLRAAVVLGATGVAVVALGEVFGAWAGLSSTGRAPGATLGQRNMVAHLLLLASPAAWTLAARASRPGPRVVALLAAALMAAGVLVTRSRAAWLTGPAVLLVWWWLSERTVWVVLAVGAALAVAAVATPHIRWSSKRPYAESLAHLVDARSGSGRGRLVQYAATARLVAQHPLLGVGPSNWLVEYPAVSPPGDPTIHETGLGTGRLVNSDWLALACEEGVPAVLVAAALVVLTVRRARKVGEGALAVSTVVALLGVGAFDAVLQLPAAVASAALILGSCARGTGEPVPRPVRATWVVTLGVLCALACARLVGLHQRALGGFEHLEQAVAWNPADLEARLELTEALVLDGKCERARPHVVFLRAALPHHSRPREFERACP